MEVLSRTSMQTFADAANALLITDVGPLIRPTYADIAKASAVMHQFQQRSYEVTTSWNDFVVEIQSSEDPVSQEVLTLAERCSDLMLSIYQDRRFTGIACQGLLFADTLKKQIEEFRKLEKSLEEAEASAVAVPATPAGSPTAPSLMARFSNYLDTKSPVLGPTIRMFSRGADYMANRSYTAAVLRSLRAIVSPTKEAHNEETSRLVEAARRVASSAEALEGAAVRVPSPEAP